jgi:hypothetical protein
MKFFATIRDLGITLALAVSFPLCVHLGVNVFYPEFQKLVQWDDKKEFLSPEEYKEYMELTKGSTYRHITFTKKDAATLENLENKYREKKHELEEKRGSIVFYVTLFFATLFIILSTIIPVPAISAGLVLAGIASAINGYWRTWFYLDAKIKFASLLVAIILLTTISFISFYRKQKNK